MIIIYEADVIDNIYDVLMGNAQHVDRDWFIDNVEEQEVDRDNAKLTLLIGGKSFIVKIKAE